MEANKKIDLSFQSNQYGERTRQFEKPLERPKKHLSELRLINQPALKT